MKQSFIVQIVQNCPVDNVLQGVIKKLTQPQQFQS